MTDEFRATEEAIRGAEYAYAAARESLKRSWANKCGCGRPAANQDETYAAIADATEPVDVTFLHVEPAARHITTWKPPNLQWTPRRMGDLVVAAAPHEDYDYRVRIPGRTAIPVGRVAESFACRDGHLINAIRNGQLPGFGLRSTRSGKWKAWYAYEDCVLAIHRKLFQGNEPPVESDPSTGR